MERRRVKMFAAVCLFAVASLGASAKGPAAYSPPDTEVIPLHSENTGADYLLYVSRPEGEPAQGKALPAVYMLDPDYSFAIVQSIVRHFAERNNLPPMVLVGIATAGGVDDRGAYKRGRTRDYTPTFVATGGYGAEFQKVSGGAPKFAAFIAEEVAPLIEKRHGASSKDRTIIGHSYGGLFAAYMLVAKPEVFQRYVIVSPSLWYDNRLIFRLEADGAKRGEAVPAHVFLSVGAFEQQQMSDDLVALKAALDARKGGAVKTDIQIFDDETHNSVFPAAVTRGLLKVFDAFPAFAPPPEPQTPSNP